MTDERRPTEPRDGGSGEARTPASERPPIRISDKRSVSAEPTRESDAEAEVLEAESRVAEADEAKALAADRLDQLLRLKADFENYRKRILREQTEVVERASGAMVEKLLPIVDDLERAIDAARGQSGAEGIVRGLDLVMSRLHDLLAAEGVERLEAHGSVFDPHHHEAVSSAPGDVSEPTVLEVVRPGYRHRGRVLRPALVHVSTPQGDGAAEESSDGRPDQEE